MSVELKNSIEFPKSGLLAIVKVAVGGKERLPGETGPGVYDWSEFSIDEATGKINIPDAYMPAKAKSRKDFSSGDFVRAFQLTLGCTQTEDRLVVITARDVNNNYRMKSATLGTLERDFQMFTFDPCDVVFAERDKKLLGVESDNPRVVFTTPKSQAGKRGTNRAEAWTFEANGKVKLHQFLVNTWDDGETFRLVNDVRWSGTVYRLPEAKPYLPQDDRKEILQRAQVRELLDQLIFVPDDYYTGFDSRAEILQNGDVRKFLANNIHTFPVWNGKERNFTTYPVLEGIRLEGKRGHLKWFSHGLGSCGFGLVTHTAPDGTVTEYQIRYHGVEGCVKDDQGLLLIRDGDVIEWDGEVDMGEKYPPLLKKPRVQLVHVGPRRAGPVYS